ncbi:flagellar protein FlgN [Paenibacillus sp. P96]|uniref:Flagellar protein FlgN n=1 Tax=Paenibacillus zeirhizosphaerae TaxID=2987519 RepID=A0ABT9FV35_9BACL|nr:flagellar protein FlgN [Paenibacillus sp. P96]MDP4098602.1 flagellar protein FlgN [Paenibacillus sp. P96]
MTALDKLIAVLEQLEQSHSEMLDLSQWKRQAIVNNEVDELIKILNKESRFMKQLESLEKARMDSVHEFLQERGIKSLLNLSITELSRLVFDHDDKQRLFDIQQKLSSTLQELKRLNELNQKLIEQSIMFLDLSMEMFSMRPEQEATYKHPSQAGGAVGRTGLFDARG